MSGPRRRRTRATPFQADILALQLELFAANQKRINASVEGYTDEFRRYESRYRRTVRKVDGPTSFDELIRATAEATVTLVGDYHTLAQSQRTFYRILRRQEDDGRGVVIALEMFPAGCEKDLERFIKGRIREKTLLRRLGHTERWPFGALKPLHPVFELCRARGWRVIGIDAEVPGEATLHARDAFAAERVATSIGPDERAFVLIGEMHLAPSHLPKSMKAALRAVGRKGSVLRVHQNPERIWFEQAEHGVPDEHEVLRLTKHAYALLSASPVVCQQSFLTWLDRLQDGDVEDLRTVDPDTSEALFKHAAELIARAFDLPLGKKLDRVEIGGPADLSFFDRLCRSGMFTREEARHIKAHILASESYYIPRAQLVYLATLSVNHAAEEASHYLRHQMSGEGLDDPQGMVDAFYGRILNEAVGFMGSKIVNPKRKAVHMRDLHRVVDISRAAKDRPRSKSRRRGVPRLASTGGHEAGGVSALDPMTAAFVVAHKQMEKGEHVPWLAKVFDADAHTFNAVTHVLGYILGDHLYYALVRGKITKAEAKNLYFEPFEDEGAALLLYFELIGRVGNVKIPARP